MESKTFPLFITSVESVGPLLKIWGQSDQTSMVFIERYLHQLKTDFEAGHHVPNIASLKVGQQCVGMYNDGVYYRASIMDLSQIREGYASVLFIDHGNTESIPLTSIRVVEGPSPLSSFLPLAQDYILSGIVHANGAWDQQSFDVLNNMICNMELKVLVVTTVGNYRLIEVEYQENDLSKVLITYRIAAPCSISTQLQILNQKIPSPPKIIRRVAPIVSAPVFKNTILPIHSEHIVTVSAVDDGPKSFTVQLQSWEKLLDKIMMEVNSGLQHNPLHESPVPGTLCLGRLKGALARAVITQLIEDQCKVYFVDFGHTEIIPYSELYQLPPSFIIQKILALRFSLCIKSVTQEMKNLFKKLALGKTFKLRVAPPEGPPVLQYCDLFDEKGNILNTLKQHLEPLKYKLEPQETDCIADVEIPYVKSCQEFYISFLSESDNLQRLMGDVAAYCEEALDLDHPKVGMPVCALFPDDGQWYRAEILQLNPLQVMYIDYGNQGAAERIKTITPELVNRLPIQAIQCCLNGFENAPVDPDLTIQFENLVYERKFTMKILKYKSPKVLLVDLTDTVSREIVSQKLYPKSPESIESGDGDSIKQNWRQNRSSNRNFENETSKSRSPDKRDFRKKDSYRNANDRPPRFDAQKNDWNSPPKDNKRNTNTWNSPPKDFKRSDSQNSTETRRNLNDSWRSPPKERTDSYNSENKQNNRKDSFNTKDTSEFDNKRSAKDSWNNSPPKEFKKFNNDSKNFKKSDNWNSSSPPKDSKRFDTKRNDKRSDRPKSQEKSGYGSDWSQRSDKSQKQPDYANLGAKYQELALSEGAIETVNVSWFYNPKHFYVQVTSSETEFKRMMVEIQRSYKKRPPASNIIPVGAAVIAHFSEDNFLYRAQVLDVRLTKYKVRFIDYGNTNYVDKSKIWLVETQFMKLPAQAVVCTLSDIFPSTGDTWPDCTEVDDSFNKKGYQCVFQGYEEEKRVVSLSYEGMLIADDLVAKGLAARTLNAATNISEEQAEHIPGIEHNLEETATDLDLLPEQVIRIFISSVCGLDKFYVHLDKAKAELVRTEIDRIASSLTLEPIPSEQLVNGTNCIIKTDEKWQRCIITNIDATTGLYIEYPDIGGGEEVTLDQLFSFPVELSHYFYQSHEAHINDYILGCVQTLTDEEFQTKYESKEVLAYIHEVNNGKLALTLYELDGTMIELVKTDENAYTDPVSPVCPMPVLHCNIKVWVTHINSVDSIYVQRSSDNEAINTLLNDLFVFYEIEENRIPIEPTIDALCVTKSSDGNYYRARILDENKKVLYVDYGNTEDVEAVWKLDSKFWIHELGLHVSLPVKPVEDCVEKLNELTGENDFVGTLGYCQGCWYIELYHDGVALSPYLIETGLAANLDFDPFKRRETSQQPDDRIVLYITHADTPNQFYAQLANEEQSIQELQAEIENCISTASEINAPEPGVLCAGKYSADDVWYRAEVLDADESITTVRFIDYGNTDVLDNSAMRTLPAHMLSINRYAKKCSLDLVPVGEEWSQTACELFEDKIVGQTAQANILYESEGILYLNVVVNDENLSESLIAEGYGKPKDRDLELSSTTGFASHINSTQQFWIQLESSCNDLEMVSDQLSIADAFPDLIDIKPGVLCAARFPDDNDWYRARILTTDPLEVLYIDYGNSSIVTELKMLPEQVVTLRALALKCTLQTDIEATDKFKELAADGATVFEVKILATGETSTVELSIEGINIIQLLEPKVWLSCVESAESFYVQSNLIKIKEIEENIQELNTGNTSEPTQDLYLGSYNDKLYRVQLIKEDSGEFQVQSIDYGYKFNVVELLECPEELLEIPAQAQHCYIQLPEGVSEWPLNVTQMLKKFQENQQFFDMSIIKAGDPNLVSLRLESKNLVEILTSSELEMISEEVGESEISLVTEQTPNNMTEVHDSEIVESNVEATEKSEQKGTTEIEATLETEQLSNTEIVLETAEIETTLETEQISTTDIKTALETGPLDTAEIDATLETEQISPAEIAENEEKVDLPITHLDLEDKDIKSSSLDESEANLSGRKIEDHEIENELEQDSTLDIENANIKSSGQSKESEELIGIQEETKSDPENANSSNHNEDIEIELENSGNELNLSNQETEENKTQEETKLNPEIADNKDLENEIELENTGKELNLSNEETEGNKIQEETKLNPEIADNKVLENDIDLENSINQLSLNGQDENQESISEAKSANENPDMECPDMESEEKRDKPSNGQTTEDEIQGEIIKSVTKKDFNLDESTEIELENKLNQINLSDQEIKNNDIQEEAKLDVEQSKLNKSKEIELETSENFKKDGVLDSKDEEKGDNLASEDKSLLEKSEKEIIKQNAASDKKESVDITKGVLDIELESTTENEYLTGESDSDVSSKNK